MDARNCGQGVSAGYGSLPRAGGRRRRTAFRSRLRAVHPHVRGDDEPTVVIESLQLGSPPRAWGRRFLPLRRRLRHRFTPTCVGTTMPSSSWLAMGSVHPHVRGDDALAHGDEERATGSPPRAWGRPSSAPPDAGRSRFTPTCVGTTATGGGGTAKGPVHPHVRGDDERFDGGGLAGRGSPPRAWGRLRLRRAARGAGRFTPTCVGTTSPIGSSVILSPVHPHVRGDDRYRVHGRPGDVGSPPRAWGRLDALEQSEREVRFTPTCVGTTGTSPGGPVRPAGSPPRAWGRRPGLGRRCLRPTVHPHVRGDD